MFPYKIRFSRLRIISAALAVLAVAAIAQYALGHVINVTAQIENAIAVPTAPLAFGTVFPQEHLSKPLDLALSSTFLAEPRVDDVEYVIRQKPTCGVTKDNGKTLSGLTATGNIVVGDNPSTAEVEDHWIDCGAPPQVLTAGETWGVLPSLCEYISKEADGTPPNDGTLTAFHKPWSVDASGVVWNDTPGQLIKSGGDTTDNWNIGLAVPCFGGTCAQDWESFVHTVSGSTSTDATKYIQPIENAGKVFGCDLWVEVNNIGVPPVATLFKNFPVNSALAFEAHVVTVTAKIDPTPNMCDAKTKDYWANNEGCSAGTGASIWASQVQSLSSQFSSTFSSITPSEICQSLWTTSCPTGTSTAASMCQARADLLTADLNVVSKHLELDAFIAGAYDGTCAFTNLGLSQVSTVQETLMAIEGVITNPNATAGELANAGHVAQRLITFYDEENPFYPQCIFNLDDIPQCMNSPKRIQNINNAAVDNSCPAQTPTPTPTPTQTPVGQPTVQTGAATNITSNSATLNGVVNPNGPSTLPGNSTIAYFQWGTSVPFTNSTPTQAIGNAQTNINVSADLVPTFNFSGLLPGTLYQYQIVASNGNGQSSFGEIRNFTTSSVGQPPTPTPTPTPTPSPTPSPSPSPTPTPVSNKFQINDRIKTNAPLNVRATPGTTGTILGSQLSGALGTIIGGPTGGNALNWWQVNYDTGADGWSAEDFMDKVIASPPPTPSPSPSPSPTNHAPTVLFPTSGMYAGDGINPNRGVADKDTLTFSAIYTDADNTPPASIRLVIEKGNAGAFVNFFITPVSESDPHDTKYSDGKEYTFSRIFPKGDYRFRFEASDGTSQTQTPYMMFKAGYSNVAFLPGIEGSRLYYNVPWYSSDSSKLWEPDHKVGGDEIRKLFLTNEGTSLDPDIYAKDAIDQIQVNISHVYQFTGDVVYQTFLNDLSLWKSSHTIAQYGVLPYDWRLPFGTLSSQGLQQADGGIYYSKSTTGDGYLIQALKELAATSDSGKVTIVGHSLGGLLTKWLTQKLIEQGHGDLIDQIVLVASPQLGTPRTIASLLHGYGEELSKHHVTPLSTQDARDLGYNMRGAYYLLPSESYMNRVKDVDNSGIVQPRTAVVQFDPSLSSTVSTDPIFGYEKYRTAYGETITTYPALKNFLLGVEGRTNAASSDTQHPYILSSAALTEAEKIHNILDNWTPAKFDANGHPLNINVVQIAGWGAPDTVRNVVYTATSDGKATIAPVQTFDGDGTVVIPSAVAMRGTGIETYYVNLFTLNSSSGNGAKKSHFNFMEVPGVLTLIDGIVHHLNNPVSGIPYLSTNTDTFTASQSYLRLALHSPVSIDLYDKEGRHAGIATSTTAGAGVVITDEQIPNSYYMNFGEGKYAGLEGNAGARVVLKGESLGTFTFDIQEVRGNTTIASTSFVGIPVTASSTAIMTIDTTASSTPLLLDVSGDGTSIVSLTPGEGVSSNDFVTILKGIVKTLDMPIKKKDTLLKKIDKLEKAIAKEYKNEKQERKHVAKTIDGLSQKIKKLNTKGALTNEDAADLLGILDTLRKTMP